MPDRKVRDARGIKGCMGRNCDCRDNEPMESANGTLKVDCVHGERFRTRAAAQQAIVEHAGYYNAAGILPSSGSVSPAEFEHGCYADAISLGQAVSPCTARIICRRSVSGSSQASEPVGRG